jgi:hypothetical protein
MRVRYVSLLAIVLVLSGGVPLMFGGNMNYATAKYANTNTQSQANSNECNTSTNCAITSPQTQGGTANSPVNTQISNFNERQEEELPTGHEDTLAVTQCTQPGAEIIFCLITFPAPYAGWHMIYHVDTDRYSIISPTSPDLIDLSCVEIPVPNPLLTQTLHCFIRD